MPRITAFALVVAALATGCTRYVELTKTDPRIWLISDDNKKIYRCVDLVPAQGEKGAHVVECIQARVRSSERAEE